MRLTKKEKAGIIAVVDEGIGQSYYHLLQVLNSDGYLRPDGAWELYNEEELDRMTSWIWKKLGLDD